MPFLPVYFLKYPSITIVTVSIALSVQLFSRRALAILGGIIADNKGPKFAMLCGIVFCFLGYVGFFITRTSFMFIMAAFLNGLGIGFFSPSSKIMLLQNDNTNKKGILLSIRNVAMNIGTVSGPVIGALLYSWSVPLLLLSVALIYGLLFLLFFFKLSGNRNKESSQFREKISFSFLRKPLYIIAMILTLVYMFGFSQLEFTMPLYAHHLFNTKGPTILFVVNAIVVIVLAVPLTSLLIKTHSIIRMVFFSLFTLSVSILLLGIFPNYSWFICMIVIFSISEIIFFPSIDIIVTDMAPKNIMGTVLGFGQIIMAIGGILGNSIAGHMYNIFIDKRIFDFWLYFGGIILIISLILFILYTMRFRNKSYIY